MKTAIILMACCLGIHAQDVQQTCTQKPCANVANVKGDVSITYTDEVTALREAVAAYKHLAETYRKALCATLTSLKPKELPKYCTDKSYRLEGSK